ncbi:MAG: cytochrome C oxidase subunit IV family protein [Acidimicrobiia bacterium]
MATENPTVEEATEEEHADHLSPANYWMIALFLAIVTAVEVAITYIPGYDGALLVTSLLVLGIVKFLTVVAFFMHLKYEPFTMNFMFYFGLLGALALFIAVLLSFRALFDNF